MYVSESKEAFPQCNALISSVPVQSVSESKEILPHCNALISSVPVLFVSESKEIFPHCNAPTGCPKKNARSWLFVYNSNLERARNKGRVCFEKFRKFCI